MGHESFSKDRGTRAEGARSPDFMSNFLQHSARNSNYMNKSEISDALQNQQTDFENSLENTTHGDIPHTLVEPATVGDDNI